MTDDRQTKNAASEGTCESPCSVPPGFADYWAGKWPGQTRNHEILARSAHYQGCRDAWESALKWSGYYEAQDAKKEPNGKDETQNGRG